MYPMTQIVTGNLPSYTTGEEGGLITAQGWAWAAALALCGRDGYETIMNKLRTRETYHAVKQAHPKLIAERFGEFDKTIPSFENPQVDETIIAKMIDAKGSPLLAPESFSKPCQGLIFSLRNMMCFMMIKSRLQKWRKCSDRTFR
ncbi:Oidioi.mRNA.OKI2018_I69.PAR.g10142.t1.cds [Oikopleura dioica]|uniref:Oidioi.mRNA.OKI2018_I69.PAR.g10142.t1.cds n=1 Tax=Oikopleura dioica TaxID=34765 RepID=A0ABN7RUA1_OIKDI|nr:Oidioi.mRNA.OKI2018_I69.PAR.g10142.t1.cds [Oikopleura dioica]